MVLEPRLDAFGVEGVAARQELAVLAELEVRDADRASGHLQRAIRILLAVLFLDFDDWQPVDHGLLGGPAVVLLLLLLLYEESDEVLEGHVVGAGAGATATTTPTLTTRIKHKLHGPSSSLLLLSATATSLRLIECIFKMVSRSPLTSEVLAVADAELLRVETRETITHVHHVLIVEHLVEVEGSDVVIEQVLSVLLADARSPAAHLLLLLALLLLLLLLLLPLLLLLLSPQVIHLRCKG